MPPPGPFSWPRSFPIVRASVVCPMLLVRTAQGILNLIVVTCMVGPACLSMLCTLYYREEA